MTLGLNIFGDLTMEEYTKTYLSKPPSFEDILGNGKINTTNDESIDIDSSTEVTLKRKLMSHIGHPPSLDWRKYGAVQMVKNQGACGSCYTFSAAGAIETSHFRKYHVLPDVSEQQIIDCTVEFGNGGCGGGWMHTAFKWIQEKSGYVEQKNYPYTGKVGICLHNKPLFGKISKHVKIPQGNEEELLEAVATSGTVSIAYNAGSREHTFYKSGIFELPNCEPKPTHAVLVVGYGVENGKEYWILKNSWGVLWGEKVL
eukprot:gene5823-7247_t